MLGIGKGITKGSPVRSVTRKGLQAWYKADRTQAPLGEEKVEDGGFNRSSVKVYNTGKALSFDGSDDYVDFGSDVNNNGIVWTTAIWIGDYTRGSYDWIYGKENTRNIGLNKGSSLTGNVFYRSSDGTYNEFSCDVFKSNFTNAKRLVFTSDGTDISLYIDGELIDTITPTTTDLKLGRLMAGYDTSNFIVDATVSDFQLYDVAWTQDDVIFDYNNPQKLVTEAPLREEILGEEEVENGNFETGEVGSTNLITYSEDFSDSSWVEAHYGNATAPVLTLNSSESPDGTQNASRLQIDCGGNSSSDYSYFSQVATLDGSSEYTISFYVKSNTSSDQDFLFFNNNSFGASITATAEWQRVESTFTSNSTNPRKFGLVTKGNVQEEVDILIWGAQLEELPYATSYIKTEGSTQSRANTTEWSDYNSANINATIPKALYLPNGGSYVTQAVTEPGKSYRYVIVARSETSTLSDINLQTGSTIQKVIEDVPTSYTTYIGVIGSDSSSFLLGEGGPGSVIIDSISLKEVTQSSSLSEELLPSISDFTIDVNDTDEVSIVDGSAVFNSSSVGGEYLYKGSVPNINTSGVLELSMTVEDHVSGNVRVYFGNPSAVGNDDLIASGDGTFKINITPDSNTFYIQATGGGFEGAVTNVSAKEISLSNSYAYAGNPEWVTAQPYIPQYAMSSYSKKMFFDGVDDYVSNASSLDCISREKDFSVSTWFVPYEIPTTSPTRVGLFQNSHSDIDRNGLNLDDTGKVSGNHYGIVDQVGSKGWTSATSDSALEIGKLYHVVWTNGGYTIGGSNNNKLYINGVLQSGTTKGYTSASVGLYIGKNSNNEYSKSIIDEVSVFDKELSATEVQELFNSGMALDARDHSCYLGANLVQYPDFSDDSSWNHNDIWTIDEDNNRAVATASNYTSGTALNQSGILEEGEWYEVSFEILEITSGYVRTRAGAGGTWSSLATEKGVYTYTLQSVATYPTYFYLECSSTTNASISNVSVKKVDLKGYWRNNGVDEWTDLSLYGNNGTVNGSPTTIQLQEVPYFKKDTLGLPMNKVRERALNLDGDSYAEIADADNLDFGTGDFSIEAWAKFKYENTDSVINVIIGLGGLYGSITSASLVTDSDQFKFHIGGTSVSSSSTLAVSQWYHIVGTRTGTTMRLYIDAEIEGGTSTTSSQTVTNSEVKYIGKDSSSDRPYQDLIDDVRIYNRALSSDEVAKNYKAGLNKHKTGSSFSDDFSSDYGF